MSVQFSHSVMSDSLRPHGLQHARLPCPPTSPKACSNSGPLSRYAIQPSHLLSSPSPAFNLSQHQGLFQCVLCIRQPKYWTFSFSISSSVLSFLYEKRVSSQLSHPHMTAGKTIALTRQTFVGKVMSLLFNMLSRFV